jgi:hypothetical protein
VFKPHLIIIIYINVIVKPHEASQEQGGNPYYKFLAEEPKQGALEAAVKSSSDVLSWLKTYVKVSL